MFNILETLKTSLTLNKKFSDAVRFGYNPISKEQYKKYNAARPDGAKPIFCYLPYNSLTFSFSGKVYVCGYNRDIVLGEYPRQTIDQIWNSEHARALRKHMFYNDLGYGCQHCKFFFDKGKFSNLRPLVFDKYYGNTDAKFPRVFEFELNNTCNLECQMCHGEVSSSIRKNRDKLPPIPSPYDEAFVEQLSGYIPHLKEAKFYGGEPFLIPIYYKIWEKVKALNPGLEMFVITNGTNWNEKIRELVSELNFDLAVSIDAFEKEKLERIRKNVVYEELLENIRRFSRICNDKGKHLSLSFTMQKDNWEQLPLIIGLCNELNAFIYVSYLERPVRFSIADLPKQDLQKIRDYMEGVSLPRHTAKERHNFKCFEDFKTYLERYISNEEELKYADYEFNREKLKPKEKHTPKEPARASAPEWRKFIERAYAQNPELSAILPQEAFFYKTENVLNGFPENDLQILRGGMLQTDIEVVVREVADTREDLLKEACRISLKEHAAANDAAA